jgi:hypothetical protein
MCRFYGNKGYQIYYEYDLWYTSACQYCTCRRHNRIICKSIQCEHQFCLEHEIQESRSDSCCVSCRQAKQCHFNGHILKVKSNDYKRHFHSMFLFFCSRKDLIIRLIIVHYVHVPLNVNRNVILIVIRKVIPLFN